jgi:hypothetical protein
MRPLHDKFNIVSVNNKRRTLKLGATRKLARPVRNTLRLACIKHKYFAAQSWHTANTERIAPTVEASMQGDLRHRHKPGRRKSSNQQDIQYLIRTMLTADYQSRLKKYWAHNGTLISRN